MATPPPGYRVAVIGCGSHGTRLARTFDLDPRCRVVAGANRGREGLDLFCGRFGGLPGYQDYRRLLAEEEFEIALLALPVSVNPEVVAACAARKGIAGIFSEKPVAVSLAEADGAVEACEARGIPWSAGDMFRNAPEIWTARRLVESGEIGEVESMNIYGCGGNQMSGQGCRQLSDGFMFAGDAEVEWVVGAVDGDPADADLGPIDEHSDHDQGAAFGAIGFANGLTAHLHRNITARNGIEVLGSDGVLFIGQSRIGRIWRRTARGLEPARNLFPDPDPGQTALHEYDAEGWEVPRTRMTDSVAAFLDAVESGGPVSSARAPTCARPWRWPSPSASPTGAAWSGSIFPSRTAASASSPAAAATSDAGRRRAPRPSSPTSAATSGTRPAKRIQDDRLPQLRDGSRGRERPGPHRVLREGPRDRAAVRIQRRRAAADGQHHQGGGPDRGLPPGPGGPAVPRRPPPRAPRRLRPRAPASCASPATIRS